MTVAELMTALQELAKQAACAACGWKKGDLTAHCAAHASSCGPECKCAAPLKIKTAIAVGDSLRIETTAGESFTLRVTSHQHAGRCVSCNRLTGKDALPGAEMCARCEAAFS